MTASELMQALSDAGAPMEAIIIAVRALEQKDAELAQGRAAARERKRRQRERDKDSHGTVTGQSEDNRAPDPTPSLSPQTPQTHPHPSNNKPARVKGHRLPTTWQPTSLTGDLGTAVATWPRGAIERELDRFRDWAASANGPNALKLDWQAAWRNWLRKAVDDGRYPPGGKGPAPPGGSNDYLATMLAKQAATA